MLMRNRALSLKRVRGVARAVPQQILNLPEIVADDVQGDGLDLERRELLNRRIAKPPV